MCECQRLGYAERFRFVLLINKIERQLLDKNIGPILNPSCDFLAKKGHHIFRSKLF